MAFVLLAVFSTAGMSSAQTVCSARVTDPDGRALPVAHVTLLTPDRVTVLQTLPASADGLFSITIPRTGSWVLRVSGVDAASSDIGLFVPDSSSIQFSIALGSHRYLDGEPSLSVIGNFNLWSIPNAVPLKKTGEGVFEADIPSAMDSVLLRVRGFRDADGGEGVRNASFVLNKEWGYDARVKTSGGVAHVVVDPLMLDRSGSPARLTFEKASRRTQRIAAALREWWQGEEAYFASQMDMAMERETHGKKAPDWYAFVAGLVRQADAEKDTLVRAFWDLGYVCTSLKSIRKDPERFTKSMGRLPATSIAWSFSPNTLPYAVRNTRWEPSVYDRYVKAAMERHPDPIVRRRVLFNEFTIAFNAEQDAKAQKYYNILTRKYADTPEGKQTLKDYPRPQQSKPGK